ncbi:MAG: hypothetical protein WCF30_10935 [Terracidiphilus sp.]
MALLAWAMSACHWLSYSVKRASGAGALGGKLLGAGGGGFILFYVPREKREALRLWLKRLLCVPFTFSTKGSEVVVYEPEVMYDQVLAAERRFVYGEKVV